jgi:hypothetical protein
MNEWMDGFINYIHNDVYIGNVLVCTYYVSIIYLCNPSGRTMALESTQPLTEMNARCIS